MKKTGTVKFFNHTKGFGFISADYSKQEYFVHSSGLIDSVKDGDDVQFELKEGKKGMNAVDVTVLRRQDSKPYQDTLDDMKFMGEI